MNSYYHAKKSANKWGGDAEEYLAIHDFFDSSGITHGDVRHRALLHHTFGVNLCVKIFGTVLKLTCGKEVPVKEIAEQHILDDLGRIPSPTDYLNNMNLATWMGGKTKKHRRIKW